MKRSHLFIYTTLALSLLVAFPSSVSAKKRRSHRGKGSSQMHVILDGSRTRVVWNDGDSFRIIRGPKKDVRVRLADYNTLESYGPVHFWGGFHGFELYDLAKASTKLAKQTIWECSTTGQGGGYGREVVRCPELSKEMIRQGLAHLFGVEKKPDSELLKLQLQAQAERRGIWKKGVPSHIVTSIHSISEKKKDGSPIKEAYNRVCNTRTGMTHVVKHKVVFQPCDAWCHGGSCMVYAPFEVRYGENRPSCLRQGRSNRLVVHPKLGYPMPVTP